LDSARLARRFSNKRLAKITGISESSISDYMHGKREPEYARLQAMCKALNISPGYVLDETTPQGSLEELIAWDAFLRWLKQPPQAATEWARDLGAVDLPQAISHHKKTNRPDHPPVASSLVPSPETSGGPPEVQLGNLPAKTEPLSTPKRKRKPL
jgi:transcriptional regulator with XRE-family HTH domain